MQIVKELQEARNTKRMTQANVAKKAGMPQPVIARIEGGNHSLSFDTLVKIAHALGKKVKIV